MRRHNGQQSSARTPQRPQDAKQGQREATEARAARERHRTQARGHSATATDPAQRPHTQRERESHRAREQRARCCTTGQRPTLHHWPRCPTGHAAPTLPPALPPAPSGGDAPQRLERPETAIQSRARATKTGPKHRENGDAGFKRPEQRPEARPQQRPEASDGRSQATPSQRIGQSAYARRQTRWGLTRCPPPRIIHTPPNIFLKNELALKRTRRGHGRGFLGVRARFRWLWCCRRPDASEAILRCSGQVRSVRLARG